MTRKIYCIAEFEPKTEHEQELFEKLLNLESLASREDGCLRYRATRQIRHLPAIIESGFSIMVNEEWASIEDFDEHCKKQYLVEFFEYYVTDPTTSITDNFSIRLFSDEN